MVWNFFDPSLSSSDWRVGVEEVTGVDKDVYKDVDKEETIEDSSSISEKNVWTEENM